ncbi:MAG: sugar transferase, partial [Planctomycetes bacterium]|nr:sugar transferase [Planctomycetota bacterium]
CFLFITAIYISILAACGVYRNRFKSSWELFRKTSLGLFLGTLLSIAFVYVFRVRWGTFPTSVFATASIISLLLVYKANRSILRNAKKIKKAVLILGDGKVDDIVGKKAIVERKKIHQVRELLENITADEIVISEKITDIENLNLLLCLAQRLKVEILFSPSVYLELLPERINGNSNIDMLSTFVGKQSEVDEFLIRSLDVTASVGIVILLWPIMLVIALLVKISTIGPIIYKQQRAGKDGRVFTLYKFRTMVNDTQKTSDLEPAKENDPRVTAIGRILRRLRLDELPQLFNILYGDMSLVGPRPENLFRVGEHKALRGLRLAVKPGLTGLAQIRSFYDLHPKHKIKYDYLYIQRRSLWLNIYILLLTVPVLVSKKGW